MPYTDSSVNNLVFNVMNSVQYQDLIEAGTVEENELYLITDDLNPIIQTTTNLVTSISSSSTDTKYPSAKAVYTALPKATSDLTNDSGFITSSDVYTLNHWYYNISTPSSSGYFIFNAAYATGTQVEMHYNSMFIQVYGEIVLNITIAAGNRISVGSFSSAFLDLLGETYVSHFTGFTYQGKVVEIIVNTWSGANELVIYNPNTSSIASGQHVAFNLFLPIG